LKKKQTKEFLINPVPEDFKPILAWLELLEKRVSRIEKKLKNIQMKRKGVF